MEIMALASVLSRVALVAMQFCTAALADAQPGLEDSFCGEGLQYLVALQCGDAPPILQCVPDALRNDICSLPNTLWAQTLCARETGESVQPSLIEAVTGCYSLRDSPFDDFGVTTPADLPSFADADANEPSLSGGISCRSLPSSIPPSVLSSFASSDSFETEDPLATWIVDTSADPASAIRVVCLGGEGANGTEDASNLGSGESMFTDLIDMADDGDCAAVVRAGCAEVEGDYGTPGTNSMTRQFRVFNRGCVPGMMSYNLMFAVAFDDRERCDTAMTVNDTVTVSVTTGGNTVVAAAFVSCQDGDTPEWETITVDLGKVPVGTVITPTLSVESTNDEDCFLDSFVVIDDIRIVPK